MTLEYLSKPESIVSLLVLVSYIVVFLIQNKAITGLKTTTSSLKTQLDANKDLISSLKTFNEIINVDEFRKHVELKLENKDLELDKKLKEEESKLFDKTIKAAADSLYKSDFLPRAYDELATIAIGVIVKNRKTRKERLQMIDDFYPVNSNIFKDMLSIIEEREQSSNS